MKFSVTPGDRYRGWTVVEEVGARTYTRMVKCACTCGTVRAVQLNNLRNGSSASCGCTRLRHGRHGTTEYRAWEGMKARCFNPNTNHYANYGGRGITVTPEWVDDFEAFYAHVGAKPSPGMSLDRVDGDGNYEPGNVRWATATEQNRNRRGFTRSGWM